MKSGRIFALVLLMAALGVVAMLLLRQRGHEVAKRKPWPTASNAKQGYLTFMGVYEGTPEFVQVGDVQPSGSNFWGKRWAYFKYPKDMIEPISDSRFSGKGVPSILIWGQTSYSPKDPDKDYRLLAVPVPEQYAPEYQNGSLQLIKAGKEIGKWKISGMPKAVRRIPEKEPFVLEGEAVGCRLKLESPVEQLGGLSAVKKATMGHVWAPMVQVNRLASDPKDQYRMLVSPERTTWLKWKPTGFSPVQLPEKGRVCAYLGVHHEMPSDRIAFSATVQKYRTLDETIILRNLVVGKLDETSNTYVLKSCSDRHIKTKNGFEADIVLRDRGGFFEPHGFTIHIKAKTDLQNGALKGSPLYQQFKKPIRISCVNGVDAVWDDNNACWSFKLPPNKGEEKIRIPEFKVVIRQTAILDAKTLHFLAPVKEVEELSAFQKAK